MQLERGDVESSRWLAIGAVLLIVGPVLGLLGVLAGMWSARRTVDATPPPTPASFAPAVELAQIASVVGLVLVVFALWRRRRVNVAN